MEVIVIMNKLVYTGIHICSKFLFPACAGLTNTSPHLHLSLRGTRRALNNIKNSQMGIRELFVSEGEVSLSCLMFLAYRKPIVPLLAWMLALVITLLLFQARIEIIKG